MTSWEWAAPLIQVVTFIFVSGGAVFVLRQKTHDLGNHLGDLKEDLSKDIAQIKGDMVNRMGKIEDNLEKLTVVTVQQARHDERMNAMDQRQISQAKRIDDFMREQNEAQSRLARMVENTISRVNELADKGIRPARS